MRQSSSRQRTSTTACLLRGRGSVPARAQPAARPARGRRSERSGFLRDPAINGQVAVISHAAGSGPPPVQLHDAGPVPYPVPHGPGLMVSARANGIGGTRAEALSVVLNRPVPRPSARRGPESFRFPLLRLFFSPGQAELHSVQRRSD